jgi:tyrosinase
MEDIVLTPNETARSARIGAAGEVNSYRFNVTSFDEYSIETTGDTDTFMTLYGPNDSTTLVAQNDDGGDNLNSKISLNLSAGTYHISVRLYTPTSTGNYAIAVSSIPSAHIPELLIDGAEIDATISARNESDVYHFNVIENAEYTIETSGGTDTFLSLFGPDNEIDLLEQNDDGGANFNSRIRRRLNAGKYYARVRHYSTDGMGAYTIRVRR